MQQCMLRHLHETTITTTTKNSATQPNTLKLQKATKRSYHSKHCGKLKNNSNNSNTNSKNPNLKNCLTKNNNCNKDNNSFKNWRQSDTNATTATVARAPTTTITTTAATATQDSPTTVHKASSDYGSSTDCSNNKNSASSKLKMPSITLDAVVPLSGNVSSVVAVASNPVSVSATTVLQAAAAATCTNTTTTVLSARKSHPSQPPHAVALDDAQEPPSSATTSTAVAATGSPPPISALQIAAQRAAAYGCHFQGNGALSAFLPTASSALEQYRLQLYNYALNIERLRCPQYSAAAAMAAASYASSTASSHAAAANRHNMPSNGGAYSMPVGMSPGSRLALSMSLFPQRIFQPEEPKPQHSYIGLIAMAILSSAESKLVLSDIYQYILDNYPYFRTRGPGWRNSIRHNLSLNDCFIKSGRSANGKGHYWAIHPANMDDFRKGDFRRRKAQRKVRKHMGLSVDDAGTDSPSPPPLDLSASPPAHPLAAHHLAATHTFGYLQQQQHHHQQHLQQQHSHLGVLPASYPPPHQYIGQAYGNTHYAYNSPLSSNGNNGGALAQSYAYGNNSNINAANSTQPQQHNQPPSGDSSSTATDGNQLAFINETTTTTRTATATASVIANLYSQTRKRQFDVASLLAPEVKVDIVDDNCALTTIERCSPNGGIATTTQHTVITKVSVQQQQHHHHHHHHLPYHHQQPHHYYQQQQLTVSQPQQTALPRSLLELEEQEDIDVVASDVEDQQRLPDTYADVDGDGDVDTDADVEAQQYAEADAASYLSTSRRSSIDGCATDAANSSRRQSPLSDAALELNTLQLPSAASAAAYELHSNSLSSQPDSLECTTLVALAHSHDSSPNGGTSQIPPLPNALAQDQHVQRLVQQLQQQQTASSKLSGVDSNFFGRYYGTYMAAAAARRIGSISLTQLQPSIEATPLQHQLQLQQQQQHQMPQ